MPRKATSSTGERRGFLCPRCGRALSVRRTTSRPGEIRRIRWCRPCGLNRITTETDVFSPQSATGSAFPAKLIGKRPRAALDSVEDNAH